MTTQPAPGPAAPQRAAVKPTAPQRAAAKPIAPQRAAAKPTVAGLGIDLAAQAWRRSGRGDGAIEVAFVQAAGPGSADHPDCDEWILMRVAGDPEQRVLVFDRHEWECFLDGARNGEFDAAAALSP